MTGFCLSPPMNCIPTFRRPNVVRACTCLHCDSGLQSAVYPVICAFLGG
jgi:hypothetical protein